MDFFTVPLPPPSNIPHIPKIISTTNTTTTTTNNNPSISSTRLVSTSASPSVPSRYESQKRRDWNTFGQYLRNHRPPLPLSMCSSAHVLEFLRYLDQFGKTKVHNQTCPFFGVPNPPAPCPCPLRQAWGSLDALIGRLRAAYEEHGGKPEVNPFGARAVRLFLREVRDFQAKSRGISYEKKRKRSKEKVPPLQQPPVAIRASSHKSRSKPKPIPRSAGSAAFLAASISLPSGSQALMHAYMGLSGRRLLQEQNSTENNVIGQCLGWMMAAIYMGGRIPQICLNIKRGSVEGLNPLMFIFALIANATYVGSIVVRTSKWDKIKPNIPWLLDAVVCVALDLFIILQYVYYRYIRERMTSESKDYGDYYVEANKAPLS